MSHHANPNWPHYLVYGVNFGGQMGTTQPRLRMSERKRRQLDWFRKWLDKPDQISHWRTDVFYIIVESQLGLNLKKPK